MGDRKFIKMHGLGNDFVIVDARARPISVNAAGIRRLADRHTGIGFDQLITIGAAPDAESDVRVQIYNADGSEVIWTNKRGASGTSQLWTASFNPDLTSPSAAMPGGGRPGSNRR